MIGSERKRRREELHNGFSSNVNMWECDNCKVKAFRDSSVSHEDFIEKEKWLEISFHGLNCQLGVGEIEFWYCKDCSR